jgi:predicted NACHT family NTPase
MHPDEFEDEVRRVARLLWPIAQASGAQIVNGHQVDGVFETDDVVHFVEATTSRNQAKTERDAKKIDKILSKLEHSQRGKLAKGWLVTHDEPTAEQRQVTKKYGARIQILSFEHFRSRLVDGSQYLQLRANYRFGSVYSFTGNTYEVPREEYVELDFSNISSGELWSLDSLTRLLGNDSGGKVVLIGDYGSGKSMTLREIFYRLRATYFKEKTRRFPIYLNLKDHYGQVDPVEAVARHAHKVGYSRPDDIVRAWRSGDIILILDGFDEIAASGWFAINKKLSQLRFNSMMLVRQFVNESPTNCSLLIGMS